jgi:hypothetical protein
MQQFIYRAATPTLGDGDQIQPRVDSMGRLITATASPLSTSDLTAARISFSATGDQTIVSATASQTTRVYRLRLTVAGATNISIKDGAASTLEIIQFAAAGMLVLDFNTRPYWVTTANTAFILNSSAAVAVEGRIEYIKS